MLRRKIKDLKTVLKLMKISLGNIRSKKMKRKQIIGCQCFLKIKMINKGYVANK
jgi:hypothetical protein